MLISLYVVIFLLTPTKLGWKEAEHDANTLSVTLKYKMQPLNVDDLQYKIEQKYIVRNMNILSFSAYSDSFSVGTYLCPSQGLL